MLRIFLIVLYCLAEFLETLPSSYTQVKIKISGFVHYVMVLIIYNVASLVFHTGKTIRDGTIAI